MSKPKLSPVDWLSEAWKVVAHQQFIADSPGGLLGEPPMLKAPTVVALESVQDRIADFINYALYWRKPKWLPLLRGARFTISGRHPANSRGLYQLYSESFQYQFKPNEVFAFLAHEEIGQVLVDQWADHGTKQTLPLMIATIGGTSALLDRHLAAAKVRPRADRKGMLRRELERCVRNHPGETAFDSLNRLTGDGVVVGFDGKTVRYKDGVKVKPITLDHYENTFSLAKKDASEPYRGKR